MGKYKKQCKSLVFGLFSTNSRTKEIQNTYQAHLQNCFASYDELKHLAML
jgi:hypothetical protein